MSYDIELLGKDGKPVQVERHAEGGTFALGGTNDACINITYNYAKHYRFRELDGLEARDTISGLGEAVKRLGTKRDDDYWEPTPGNAGYAASILLSWAIEHPDAVWRVE